MKSNILARTLFVSTMFAVVVNYATAGTVIHVPADQPTIQAGVNAAINGDTVLVSPGTYFENINFNGKAITVTSASGPAVTIIDGQQFGPVVTFATNETRKSVISRFTIRNGYANSAAGYEGGGILITNASPTILQNVITLNTACSSGMGIAVYGGPLIQGNIIDGNFETGCSGGPGGGGIYLSGGTNPQIIGNVIADNAVYFSVGTGGISASGTAGLVISYNVISGNYGGGIYLSSNPGDGVLVQNLIVGNTGGPGIAWGGPPAVVVSNTIAGNSQYYLYGNGSEVAAGSMNNQLTFENNILIGTASTSAVSCGNYDAGKPPVFANNDAYSVDSFPYDSTCPSFTGTGSNISADPLFVTILSDNYRIQSGSPAINTGNNLAPDLPKKDFAGDPRIINNLVDIGADEYTRNPVLTLSSYSLQYGNQQVGTTSVAQPVTLTNHGATSLSLKLIATGSSFSQTNHCGASLGAGASCQISVFFSPFGGGAINSVLGIFTSATLNPQVVFLAGIGLAPQVSLCCGLNFYAQVIGTTSTQTDTLTNTGQAPLTISNINFSGPADFVESNNCPVAPSTLAINSSCTLTVSYTPSIVGTESGTITVTDNAVPSKQTLAVSGSSVSAGNPVLSPTSLTFPTTLIGQSSTSQTATLTNAGSGPMAITAIYSYGDFHETNNCPSTLVVNASCTLTVTYSPSSQGTGTASVYVNTDSAFGASLSVTGTGSAPVPTISSLSLPNVPVGSADTRISIAGTGFVYSSQVLWNGVVLPCCPYTSGNSQMTFTIPAANLVTTGTAQISVVTPSPGGGTSNTLPFTVYTPVKYAQQSTAYTYSSITGSNLNLGYFTAVQITPPFPIQFGGASFPNLTIGSSGAISFNGFTPEFNDVIPTTQTPMLIAPFWAQLYAFGSGTNNNVFWEVLGTAPNRQLVIEWRNVGMCCETTNTIKFEVVFFEGNSNILFNYADTIFGGGYSYNDNGATATSGVQVASGLGTQFSYNQPLLLSKTALLWYPSNPTATLSTSTIGFGYHQIGSSTLPQPVTLINGGLVPLNISSLTTDNPDFRQTNSCGSSVPPGKSCTIHVTFKPTQPSAETATLTIVDNATNSPQTVALTGVGTITPIVVYPILVTFGNVPVGNSGTAPVTLANASNKSLSIQSISTAPGVYTETNNCGTSLAPGLSCTITVTFKPTQKGSIQGTLSMSLNGSAAKVEATLSGSGN